MLRSQLWIVPDAKPQKKRKKVRRRKRVSSRMPKLPRPPRVKPPRELKRQYKPLGTEIFNLPAGLIDCFCKNKLNLRKRAHLKAAHQILDKWAAREIPEENTDAEEVEAMHGSIDRLARCPRPIADQIEELRREFEIRAAEVRDGIFDPNTGEMIEKGWSQHHRDKSNNYLLPPLEVDRVGASQQGHHDDSFE
jgi:hypothetical protein